MGNKDLCSRCQYLDLRALLLASASMPVPDDVTVWQRLSIESIKARPALYFQLQQSLVDLRSSSSTCRLCLAIWTLYQAKGGHAKDYSEEATRKGLGLEPVWMTRTPANDLWQKYAQVVVFQKGSNHSTRVLASFDPFADRASLPMRDDNVLLRSIYSYSGSQECLHLARTWLQDCLETHKDCEVHGSSGYRLPTRVLDVGYENSAVRLIDGAGRDDRFAALSYCWGGEAALILQASTEQSLREGIPLQDFPATLRDAVIITRNLGIQWLWIDALCIRQDDSEDWAAGAAKMRDVYRGAVITIAAAAASKGSEGIFVERTPPVTLCQLEWRSESRYSHSVYLRPSVEVMDKELRSSTINSRGWCFQESLLAPRTLWYAREQLVFECGEGQVNEAGHATQATEYYRSKDMMKQLTSSSLRRSSSQALRWLGVPTVIQVPYYARRPPASPVQGWMISQYQLYTQGALHSQSGRTFTIYKQWREIVNGFTDRNLTKTRMSSQLCLGLPLTSHR